MLSFWRTSKATHSATTAILPFVERSRARLGGIPDFVWRDPYVLGFLSMLITLIGSEQGRGRLSDEEIGIVQLNAWLAITGIPDDLIGEEICRLSSSSDELFGWGCGNARAFFVEAMRRQDGVQDYSSHDMATQAATGSGLRAVIDEVASRPDHEHAADQMWRRVFDDRVAEVDGRSR